MKEKSPLIAVVGAGPAGIFAADKLADEGARVVLFNRDIKPGGLAEYGIFFDKYRMKKGLRKQFRKILSSPKIDYLGNITVCNDGDLTLEQLRSLGFDAVLITVGAQGTKWLGLPGEQFNGVYHAKDLVYHYNKLPPFSERDYPMGQRVAIIGAGNVMIDIANWAIRHLHVAEVVAVVRRDPGAVKFTKKEMQIIFANVDRVALDAEIERARPVMEAVGGDADAARGFILSAEKRAQTPVSSTKFRFEFLSQPKQINADKNGNVTGLEVEDTTLQPRNGGGTRAVGTGNTRTLPVDTVVFAIGDTVDESFGLPVVWGGFAHNPNPQFPVDEMSYEAFDAVENRPIPGLFIAGWSREASTGLVGAARKDGQNGAEAVLKFVAQTEPSLTSCADIRQKLDALGIRYVTKAEWQYLDQLEEAKSAEQKLEEFKFASNAEMLHALETVKLT